MRIVSMGIRLLLFLVLLSSHQISDSLSIIINGNPFSTFKRPPLNCLLLLAVLLIACGVYFCLALNAIANQI